MDSPASKNKSVFMPANSWSRVTHFGGAKWPYLAKRGYNIRNPSGIRLLDLGDMAIAEIHKEAMTDTRYQTPIAPTQ